jgi:hypothetical protein
MRARLQKRVAAVEEEHCRIAEELKDAEQAAAELTTAATTAEQRAQLARHRLAVLRGREADLARVFAAGRKALQAMAETTTTEASHGEG